MDMITNMRVNISCFVWFGSTRSMQSALCKQAAWSSVREERSRDVLKMIVFYDGWWLIKIVQCFVPPHSTFKGSPRFRSPGSQSPTQDSSLMKTWWTRGVFCKQLCLYLECPHLPCSYCEQLHRALVQPVVTALLRGLCIFKQLLTVLNRGKDTLN